MKNYVLILAGALILSQTGLFAEDMLGARIDARVTASGVRENG